MTFTTLGSPANPAALLIHGMLCTWKDCEPYGKFLADEYYVIMPTLDGHGNDGSDLLTVQEETAKILDWLKQNGITSLALLQGSSMGAEVALAVKHQAELEGIEVQHCFFDGGPFFHFNPVFRRFMQAAFGNMVKIFDTDDPEQAYQNMLNNPFLKFVGGKKASQYESLVQSMAQERRTFSKKTVKNMVRICYACDLPKLSEEAQRSMLFFFSDEEPARKSRKRLLKAYPQARYADISGYAHCGLQSVEPERYATLLKQVIADRPIKEYVTASINL